MKLVLDYPAFISNAITDSINVLIQCYQEGNKIIVCGNGGSASDSQHIVGELMKSFNLERGLSQKTVLKIKKLFPNDFDYISNNLQSPIEAISLVGENSFITAWINDANPDFVFAQQILGYGKKGDVLICLSTSGKSVNVINAIKIAKVKGMKVLLMTGNWNLTQYDYIQHVDIIIKSPSIETHKIQEDHIKFYHYICIEMEKKLFES